MDNFTPCSSYTINLALNIEEDRYSDSIFDIKINELDNLHKNKSDLPYNFRNTQELKLILKRILSN